MAENIECKEYCRKGIKDGQKRLDFHRWDSEKRERGRKGEKRRYKVEKLAGNVKLMRKRSERGGM